MKFKDLTEMEQFHQLKEKRLKNEILQPTEKILIKKMEKKISHASSKSIKRKINVFGKTPTTKINPKPIRFVQAERDALTSRRDSLVHGSSEEIVERLGSLKFANTTMLVRAAVLSLLDMSDKKLIEYMKKAQKNMM
ncbi:hypothetical protein [Candidatus Photodesmus blepharus]|uniref:hypothetical protein n=1 Tax=Candidatus Photodesmus blepharonis TaxID=1179155 RepID=UPI000551C8DE|nr:hypothetical protein [Candidatus Photodesmus blepharus]